MSGLEIDLSTTRPDPVTDRTGEQAAATRAVLWRIDNEALTCEDALTTLQALGILDSVSGGRTDHLGARRPLKAQDWRARTGRSVLFGHGRDPVTGKLDAGEETA